MGALDDLAAAKAGTSTGSPLEALAAKRSGAAPADGNPFRAVAGRALGAAAKVISPVSKALNYQLDKTMEMRYHGGSLDENMRRQRKAEGMDHGYDDPRLLGTGPGTPGIPEFPGSGVIKQAFRGLYDAQRAGFDDPLTYETMGVSAVPKTAARFAAPVLKAMTDTPLGAMVYDFLHWGGPVAREKGAGTVAKIRGASNAGASTGMRVQQHLMRRFETITKGLADEEKVKVAKALNGELPVMEAPGTLSPREQSAYRQLRTLTETDFKLRTDAVRKVVVNQLTRDLSAEDKSTLVRALRSGVEPEIPGAGKRTRQMAEGTSRNQQARVTNEAQPLQGPGLTQGQHQRFQQANTPPVSGPGAYTMPHVNQAALDSAKKLNALYHQIRLNIEKAMPRREDYMPWSHEAAAADAGGTEARTVNKLDRPDPRTFERPNLEITHAGQLGRGFTAMAANTGRQVERGIVHDALGALVDDPQVHKLFDETIKATGNVRTNAQKVKDAWLAAVGYPRAATVSLTPRHGANILDLLANTVGPSEAPKVLADTMALAKKLIGVPYGRVPTEREVAALTREGRELGALSGSYTERKPFFQEFPPWMPGVGGKPTSVTVGGKGVGLSAWTKFNNRFVWAIDEAAKQTYAKLIVARGEAEGLQAGGLASARLVDYAHHSPLVEALRHVAPFGTFRGGIPGAVAGGIARNPMRAALLNRATGGTMYGDKPKPGAHGVEAFNPTADLGRGLGAPQEYIRSTLGAPIQAAATLGLEALAGGEPGASVGTTLQEVKDLPKTLPHGQLPTPAKVSPYSRSVALRKARYLTYGNPVDLRWLFSAAAAGIPEARDTLTELGYGQFKPKTGTVMERIGKAALQQAGGIGIK